MAAMSGLVDAIATTPINKESIKAAKIDFIGHTEMLAALTGVNNPMTMFQTRNLRVFFFSRHLSLRQACDAITKDRLVECLQECDHALRRLKESSRKIAVAGLNPHCGEHGLFGSEEGREIEPAIAEARKLGIDAVGPVSADSVFHQALQGRFDAVLSLYHDQGHIATKTLDFERTISVTLGLPFIRTSVDHGTAFDIAGQGKASAVSMIEAIRLAAVYSFKYRQK
jgi:4-hydroxythreonine-4-phosphate dehydrogenase